MALSDMNTLSSDIPQNTEEQQTALEPFTIAVEGEVEETHRAPGTEHLIKEWHTQHPSSWRLFCGQAKEALRLLDDSSVDCVITSPPYFWLRDYKVEGQIGLEESVDGYVVEINHCYLHEDLKLYLLTEPLKYKDN